MNFFSLFVTVIKGMFPLIAMTLTGILLAILDIFNKKTIDSLTQALVNYFGPIFLFFYISSSLDISEFSYIWPLLVSPFISSFLFYALGIAFTTFFNFPKGTRHTFASAIALPNLGIVYILIEGICSPYGALYGNEYCDQGFSYISIFTFPLTLISWTFFYFVVELDTNYIENIESSEELVENQHKKTKESVWGIFVKALKMPNPKFSLIGMVFALIPGLKYVFFNREFIVYCISDTGFSLGKNAILIGQMVLGSYLYLVDAKDAKLKKHYLIMILIAKNMLLPLVSLILVYFFWVVGVFGENALMAFTVFSCVIGNIAPGVAVFTLIHELPTNDILKAILWNYFFSIFSITMWTLLFLWAFGID